MQDRPSTHVPRAHGRTPAWRAAVRVFAALAVPLLLGAAEASASEPGLAFLDARPLNVELGKLTSAEPAVCNTSGADAETPEVQLGTFVGDDGTVAPPVTASADFPARWAAGTCVPITLNASSDVPAAGAYTSVLVVSASSGIARLDLTVTVKAASDAPPTAAAPKALPDTVLTATAATPWSNAALGNGGKLLVEPAGAQSTLKVPGPCAVVDKPATCPVVGFLVNDGDIALVRSAGAASNGSSTAPGSVELVLEHADRAGAYTGTIDLAQTPADPDDDIKLTVGVRDHWLWAAAALLLGALVFSFFPQWIARRWLPTRRLSQRHEAFVSAYADAAKAFNERRKAAGAGAWLEPDPSAIAAKTQKIAAAVDAYLKTTVYVDASSESYKQLTASLELVEDDIACLAEPSRLTGELVALQTSLDALAKLVAETGTPPKPAFVDAAVALLNGPVEPGKDGAKPAPAALKIGQAATMESEAKAATSLSDGWQKLATHARRYDAWWSCLAQHALDNDDAWPAPDRARLRAAYGAIREAEHELGQVEDAASLTAFDTEKDLGRAYGHLAYLGAQHGVWETTALTRQDRTQDQFDRLRTMELVARDDVQFAAAPPGDNTIERWQEGTTGVQAWELRVAKLRAVGRSLDWLLPRLAVALTVVSAIAAGLAGFYFDKDWGTSQDYFTVIVVASAAQVVVQAVIEIIGKVLPPAPNKIVHDAAPAVVKPLDADS